jgi:hypothetical protein
VFCFWSFSGDRESSQQVFATKDSNNFVTFGHPPHGSGAATESQTRLHGEHRDMEERVRPKNSVVHKPFACERNRMRTRGWPLFCRTNALFVFSRKHLKQCETERNHVLAVASF